MTTMLCLVRQMPPTCHLKREKVGGCWGSAKIPHALQYIAPLIFINMPKAALRRDYIKRTFKRDFERLVHVPGIHATSGQVQKLKLIAPTVEKRILAVLLSHFEAVKVAEQEIRRENTPSYALIIEDDAEQTFRPFWKFKSLDAFVARLPSGWQVVQLGMSKFQFKPQNRL